MHEAAIEHLTKADKVLARLIRKVGPCEFKPRTRCSPFQALVQSVAHQQLNGIAANTILKRVMALYPRRKFPTPDDVLATPDDKLRGAGLAEILDRLTTIRGVGPWTVEMLLIFTLGRLDVLPATDFGVRKGFAVVFRRAELPKPAELLEHGERWRPYRSIAAWYLWRSLD